MRGDTSALERVIFSALADTNDNAVVELFIQLLRESPGLRRWLCSAFLDANTRSRLADYIGGKTHPPRHASHGKRLLAWLAQSSHAFDSDTAALVRKHSLPTKTSYGGLTRSQVIELIRRYQAGGAGASGGIELASFLLTHAWRQASPNTLPRAALLLLSGGYFQTAFDESGSQLPLLRHLAKAAEFFEGQPRGSITRAHYGYANWWKLSVLHYMLNHPKPRYCTRNFTRHLAAQKITVDTKDIRRFCKKHRIVQDTRPGRPQQ